MTLTDTTTTTVGHWIGGARVPSSSGRTAPVYDPALGVATKQVALANEDEIQAAIASAKAAFPAWSNLSLTKRQQILFSFREILNRDKGELAEIITSEHGKVIDDALGEIARGQEVVELATNIPSLLKGEFSDQVSTGIDVYSIRQPLGVVGIISPFNFPAMVPLWFLPIAIAAGNTVVLKPSEKDPSAAIWLAEKFSEAGLPDGVFNVLNGDKALGRRPAHEPRRRVDLVRRFHADRAVRLRDRHEARQARAGPGRREEPHAGAAGCRPRPGRGQRHQRGLRLRR